MRYGPCPSCGEPRETEHGYCRRCHALYMKGWRAGRRSTMDAFEERLAAIESHVGVEVFTRATADSDG